MQNEKEFKKIHNFIKCIFIGYFILIILIIFSIIYFTYNLFF